MNIGKTYYRVDETTNAFRRKKLFFTDENGIEWSRYDRELWEYNIVPLKLVGYFEFAFKGEYPQEFKEYLSPSFIFEEENGNRFEAASYDVMEYFPSKEMAEKHIEQKKAARNV